MALKVALTLNATTTKDSGGMRRSDASRQKKDATNWQDYKQRAHIIMNSDTLPLHTQMRKLVFSYIGFKQLILNKFSSPISWDFDHNSQSYQVLASSINERKFYQIAEKDLDTFFAEISSSPSSPAAVKSPEKSVIGQKSQYCSLM